jgi:hypothetical protein
VGHVIRATRIDELPQILNILKGDMSIVGPRPERLEHVQEYSKEIPEFSYRLKVKGGLTGYAQIYGKYNTSPYDKLRLDLMYIENYSLMLDIKLILMTIRIMLSKESTEGFEVAQELERKTHEILEEVAHEQEEEPVWGRKVNNSGSRFLNREPCFLKIPIRRAKYPHRCLQRLPSADCGRPPC